MSDRVRVEDPAYMRRAAKRMTFALVMVLALTSFFTVGGISLVRAGELPGLPFAIGGAVLQLAAVVLVVAALGVRSSLRDQSVSRSSMVRARRTIRVVRLTLFGTALALILYAVARLALGDPWTLLTVAVIGFALLLLARGTKAIITAQDRSLSPQQT
jgi:uncharacterized membrane protein